MAHTVKSFGLRTRPEVKCLGSAPGAPLVASTVKVKFWIREARIRKMRLVAMVSPIHPRRPALNANILRTQEIHVCPKNNY